MTHRVPRLSPAQVTRDKISLTMKGRPKSRKHVRAASSAHRGVKNRPRTPAQIQVTTALRARVRGMPPEEKKKYLALIKRSYKRECRLAQEQMRVDLFHAAMLQDPELYRDVARSQGWRKSRRKFDYSGIVSDGYAEGRIWWSLVPIEEAPDGIP